MAGGDGRRGSPEHGTADADTNDGPFPSPDGDFDVESTQEPGPGGDELRGGTQGGGNASLIQPGGQPGGTNALSATGGSHPDGHPVEPPTGDKAAARRQDAYRGLEDGNRKESAEVTAQQARDAADVPASVSRSGIDEGNPRQIPSDAPPP